MSDYVIKRDDGSFLSVSRKPSEVRVFNEPNKRVLRGNHCDFCSMWCDDIKNAERMTLDLANRYLYWYYTRPTPFIIGHQQALLIKRIRVRTITEKLVDEVE